MKPVILGVTTLLLAKQTRHLERLVRDEDDFRPKGWVGATETTFGREWDKGHFVARSICGAVDRAEVIVFLQPRAESGMVGDRKALSGEGSPLGDKSGNILLQPLGLRRSNGARRSSNLI